MVANYVAAVFFCFFIHSFQICLLLYLTWVVGGKFCCYSCWGDSVCYPLFLWCSLLHLRFTVQHVVVVVDDDDDDYSEVSWKGSAMRARLLFALCEDALRCFVEESICLGMQI
jgi:hypothetical protein